MTDKSLGDRWRPNDILLTRVLSWARYYQRFDWFTVMQLSMSFVIGHCMLFITEVSDYIVLFVTEVSNHFMLFVNKVCPHWKASDIFLISASLSLKQVLLTLVFHSLLLSGESNFPLALNPNDKSPDCKYRKDIKIAWRET